MISTAENQVIADELLRQGGLGVEEHLRSSLQRTPPQTSNCVEPPRSIPAACILALGKCKKDVIISLCAVAIAVIATARYLIESRGSDAFESAYLAFPIALWFSISFLSVRKLVLAGVSISRGKEHPGPRYSELEYRLIPVYLASLPFECLEMRSIVLRRLKGSPSTAEEQQLMNLRLLALSSLIVIVLLELFCPRPTSMLPSRPPQEFGDPAERAKVGNDPPPPLEPRRSLLSLAYFTHTDSYLWKHAFRTATPESVPDLRADDKAASVLFRWKEDQASYERCGLRPGFLRSLVWHFRDQLWSQQFFSSFNAVGALLPPFFLQRILTFISSKSGENAEPVHVALLYAFGMFCTQAFLVFSQSASLFLGRRLSVRFRSLLISLIFSKGLGRDEISQAVVEQKSQSGQSKGSADKINIRAATGKIANLVSNDVFSVADIGAYLHFVWPECAVQLILAGLYLYSLLGYSALCGMLAAVLLIPIQSYLTSLCTKYENDLMSAADDRLNLVSEVITNIKIVKFFGWESKFLQKMTFLRDAELHVLFKRLLMTVAQSAVSFSIPVSIAVITFYVHTQVMNKLLTPQDAFTALALFNLFRDPLGRIVGMISYILQSYVSLRRIESFLNEPATQKYSNVSLSRTPEGNPVVGFKSASFTYDLPGHDTAVGARANNFMLAGLDFDFPAGKLSLVVGRVGSGKTTLLLSLLGETCKVSGSVFLPSPVVRVWGTNPGLALAEMTAYAPQQPWLLSDTIRNNITFGSLMCQPRYDQVLQACALNPDLATFANGDLTEIGDKGTILSGGQKARVSLARALYSPAKVLLLDDVLSAVDSHTARHLFERVLMGPLMIGRTCVLVTHAVELCLPGAVFLVSLERGRVMFAGHPSLCASAGSPQSQSETSAVSQSGSEDNHATDNSDDTTPIDYDEQTRPVKALVEAEHQAVGAVSSTIYKFYYKSLGGFFSVTFALSLFCLTEVGNVASTWVLRQWAGANEKSMKAIFFAYFSPAAHVTFPPSMSPAFLAVPNNITNGVDRKEKHQSQPNSYIWLYLSAGVITLLLQIFSALFFNCRSIKAGRVIYNQMIRAILGAPVRFFDTVPIGRILNRLSKDTKSMDRELADSMEYMLTDLIAALAIIGVVIFVLPFGFLLAAVTVCLLYVGIGYLYVATTREIKRSESTRRSPVISLCTECLGGVISIRAYGDIGRYTQQMFRLIDAYNRPFFMLWMCNRWLSSRIDLLAAIFTFSVAVWMITSDLSASLSGFALSYVISLNTKTLQVVRWWSVNEINLNCLERIHEYLGIDSEAVGGTKPPAAWPSQQATIEVEGLTARYAAHLPPVLNSVSFSVRPGEKIGICGRTGSGKSTLALSFFRFIEAERGRILIDGLDISKLDLLSLRSRLTIIPQESILFTASIRWNMDPFSEHDDAQIWDALCRVGMAAPSMRVTPSNMATCEYPVTTPDDEERGISCITSLDTEVHDGGRNFSTGQRQLLAIARALLKLQTSSILILDESTASLDNESDEQIQSIIRSEMQSATILCIAHRLKTIVEYDKILVLGYGEVLEFDTPRNLLDREGSAFYELCERSGHLAELKVMASN